MEREMFGNNFKYQDDMLFKKRKGGNKWSCLNKNKPNNYGYIQIKFGSTHIMLHRLVYLFHHTDWNINDNTGDNSIDHINENKNDNRIENLEWCTNRENVEHALKTKLNRGNNKLNDNQVIQIKKEIELLKPNTIRSISEQIAPKYNVSPRTIESIICGTRWSHKHISSSTT